MTIKRTLTAAEDAVEESKLWLLEDTLDEKKHLVSAGTKREAVIVVFGEDVAKLVVEHEDENDWLLIQEVKLPAAGTSIVLE